MNKQPIKKSEARLLCFLHGQQQVDQSINNYLGYITKKLDIDISNAARCLEKMKEKGWVRTEQHINRTFFFLTGTAPITLAIEVHLDETPAMPESEDKQT